MLSGFQSRGRSLNVDRRGFDDFLRQLLSDISFKQSQWRLKEKLLTRMQRPRISPIVEVRLDINVIESCRHVRDNPENEPKRSPRLSHNHRDVLTSQSQRNHAPEIEHPVYNKCAVPVCDWIAERYVRDLCLTRDRVRVCEVDLEGHGDEGVCEREEEVGCYRCEPSPEDQLIEMELKKN